MKYHAPLILLASLTLAACDKATTDSALPTGEAPAQPQVTPAPQLTPTVETDVALGPVKPETLTDHLAIPGLSLDLPEGWTKGADKPMRLLPLLPPAEFDGAELAISRWPGDVGGFAQNVGRWCTQVGLPLPAADFTSAATSGYEQFKLGDTTATFLPLVNEQNNAAILAVWAPRGSDPAQPTETWTFKLTCKAEHAEALTTALRAMCESLKFE